MLKNFIKTRSHYSVLVLNMPNNRCKRKLTSTIKSTDVELSELEKRRILKEEVLESIRSKFEPDRKTRLDVVNKRKTRTTRQIKEESVEDESDTNNTKIKQENVHVKVKTESKTSPLKRPHVKVEYEEESDITKSPKKENQQWQPENWEQVLENIRKMRASMYAPVDDMGCHKCHDESAAPHVMRYQTLIALMLSSQTKDQVTYAAMQRLKQHGLTIENILNTTDEQLGKLIYPVGFWKSKVKYIKSTTQMLKHNYKGDIPDSVEGLCKLSGVGPKMAYICMDVAWNKIMGIGVDIHVQRISNRLGWVRKPTKTPKATREELQLWLPRDHWSEVNHLLVGFGQTICRPVKPQCDSCLNKMVCPLGRKQKKQK